MSYLVDVIADQSGKWCHNNLRFATFDEARTYGADLRARWFAVKDWKVTASDDEVNVRWHNGRPHHLYVEGQQSW